MLLASLHAHSGEGRYPETHARARLLVRSSLNSTILAVLAARAPRLQPSSMRKFLLRLLADDAPPGGHELQDQLDRIEHASREHHRRLMELEASEAVRDAAHVARMDKLARLYKRVAQRFTDSPNTNPTPADSEAPVSVLELRRRLRK